MRTGRLVAKGCRWRIAYVAAQVFVMRAIHDRHAATSDFTVEFESCWQRNGAIWVQLNGLQGASSATSKFGQCWHHECCGITSSGSLLRATVYRRHIARTVIIRARWERVGSLGEPTSDGMKPQHPESNWMVSSG